MQFSQRLIARFVTYAMAGALFITALGLQEAWAVKLLGKTEQNSLIFSDSANHVTLNKKFTLNKRGPVVIIYTAECSVAALDTSTWLNIEILIDDVPLPPPGNNVAFCTSTGSNALDGWVSAATQGRVVLDPGPHTIRIVGHLVDSDPGDQWRIDDQNLTVIIQKF